MCTSFTLLHWYLRRVPYSASDRYALACACILTACKIDYRHQALESVIPFYLQHYQVNISNAKRKLKPQEDLKTLLMIDISAIEVTILKSIEFEMEFDLPVNYKEFFYKQFLRPLYASFKQRNQKLEHAIN